MKIVKPQRLGLLSKVVRDQRRPHLTITLLLCFPFDLPRRFLHEASLWTLAADELGKDAVLDELDAKPRGEVLVTGRCFTPGRVPRTASSVRVQLGAVDKTLYVAGDRSFGVLGASEPEPFVEMPIAWTHAFGGEGHAANPLGKGIAPVRRGDTSVHPLPNVEDPRHLVKAQGDRPEPAGLDGYPLTWPQRFSKLGTYDAAWVEHDSPGFARDLDRSFFNTAPPDQRIDGYFRGDETLVIENMHPDKPRLEGTLPGVSTRCFVNQKTSDGEVWREAGMRLDTVRLFPHRQRGVLVYRGVLAIGEDDADDVLHVVAACEAMGKPRPAEHYRAVLAQRLDRNAHRDVARQDDDLMPWPADPNAERLPDDQLSGIAALLRRDGYHDRQSRRQRAQEAAVPGAGMPPAIAEELRALGIDPGPYLSPSASPEAPSIASPDLADVGQPTAVRPMAVANDAEEIPPEVQATIDDAKEKLLAQGIDLAPYFSTEEPDTELDEGAIAEAEARVQAVAREQGLDADALMDEGRAQAGPDPAMLEKQLQELRDIVAKAGGDTAELDGVLADPELASAMAGLAAPSDGAAAPPPDTPAGQVEQDDTRTGETAKEDGDEGQREAYRMFAHTFPAASRLEGDEAARLRDEVTAGSKEGRSFARCDLTGADLSGLDLQGIDLEGAMLESVVLAGADLRGANLSGAVLARADLAGADLRGAKLVGANLGSASLRDVKASGGVDLTDAVLVKADLSGADLTGAQLSTADLSEAVFHDADLGGVTAKKAMFVKVDLSGALLKGADLQRCTFIEAKVSGVDFGGANLTSTSFIKSRGDGALFRAAILRDLCVVDGSSFVDADFAGAVLAGANLMGTRLARSDFSGADLRGAVLNECDLSGATLDRAVLVDAMLIRANLSGASLFAVDLMQAIVQKANVRGADLEKANLFGADAAQMTGDGETSFAGANLKRASLAARRPDGSA